MPNRLCQETSPYLLQHADNPVDWQPWGEAALARARREDRPILLSIGYSSCHWCHVMAQESFSDPDVAAVMNRLFVNIKVDREERPDLDHIYQSAHQLLTGRPGGWPLTMFLTPDQVPFYAGTYFPPAPRYHLPGFAQVLENVGRAYGARRGEIAAQNATLLDALSQAVPHQPATEALHAGPVAAALAVIMRGFDSVHGGYGSAPKFPRPAELEFLLQRGDRESRRQALFTLRKMAEGGLYDQLGGGFFRYSVDDGWVVPHFEKMLYDNGPLLTLYADAWAITGEAIYSEAVEGTVTWLAREMRSPDGLFIAALDADSDHEEGKYYLWTPAEARAAVAGAAYPLAARHWGLDQPANFEARAWHLRRAVPLAGAAADLGVSPESSQALLAQARADLLRARQSRTPPGRDDKCLTAWNALTIKGLARAARRFGRPDWTQLAVSALDALRAHLWRDDRLLACLGRGQARLTGYLDDYAFLLDALLEMLQADFRPTDLEWARQLADSLLAWYEDPQAGGFFFTAHDQDPLILRDKPGHDQATPSGNGLAALSLGRLGHLLAEPRYLKAADRTVRLFFPQLVAQPAASPTLLAALAEQLEPPSLVVLAGPDDGVAAWQRELAGVIAPKTLILSPRAPSGALPAALAVPGGRRPAARVCTGVNCLPDIVQMADLLAAISR